MSRDSSFPYLIWPEQKDLEWPCNILCMSNTYITEFKLYSDSDDNLLS